MTDYETIIKRWAAKRLDIDPAAVSYVGFVTEEGFWYSDVTYEGGWVGMEVRVHGQRHTSKIEVDPGEVIKDCIKIIQEDSQ